MEATERDVEGGISGTDCRKKNTREKVVKKDVSAMDLDADMDAYMKQDEATESLAAALG